MAGIASPTGEYRYSSRYLSSNFRFFFQAEDGIRDIGVTGVQTCALPILTEHEVDQLLEHLIASGELSRDQSGVRLGDAWLTAAATGEIHSNIESAPGYTVTEQDRKSVV